jgi:hypothetical protein
MTGERLQQLYLDCACGEKIPLPVAVSAGKPIPWPEGDPAQNFCCLHCGEAREYSKADVHFRDVEHAESQSLRDSRVRRVPFPCNHEACRGSVEILYVADPRAMETWLTTFSGTAQLDGNRALNVFNYETYVCSKIRALNLSCTTTGKHKNSGANKLGLSDLSVVDENWEKIQRRVFSLY